MKGFYAADGAPKIPDLAGAAVSAGFEKIPEPPLFSVAPNGPCDVCAVCSVGAPKLRAGAIFCVPGEFYYSLAVFKNTLVPPPPNGAPPLPNIAPPVCPPVGAPNKPPAGLLPDSPCELKRPPDF